MPPLVFCYSPVVLYDVQSCSSTINKLNPASCALPVMLAFLEQRFWEFLEGASWGRCWQQTRCDLKPAIINLGKPPRTLFQNPASVCVHFSSELGLHAGKDGHQGGGAGPHTRLPCSHCGQADAWQLQGPCEDQVSPLPLSLVPQSATSTSNALL